MDNLWRFYDGVVSGIVVAESALEALALARAYLEGHFADRDQGDELQVWP